MKFINGKLTLEHGEDPRYYDQPKAGEKQVYFPDGWEPAADCDYEARPPGERRIITEKDVQNKYDLCLRIINNENNNHDR